MLFVVYEIIEIMDRLKQHGTKRKLTLYKVNASFFFASFFIEDRVAVNVALQVVRRGLDVDHNLLSKV